MSMGIDMGLVGSATDDVSSGGIAEGGLGGSQGFSTTLYGFCWLVEVRTLEEGWWQQLVSAAPAR